MFTFIEKIVLELETLCYCTLSNQAGGNFNNLVEQVNGIEEIT